jgi:Ca2+-binding EF-hand superfamily protein
MKMKGVELNDQEIQALIQEADIDGDGYIDYQEFARIMMEQS